MRPPMTGLAGLILAVLATAWWLTPGFSLAARSRQGNQEMSISTSQPDKSIRGAQVPPLDTRNPAHIETATFGLG